MKIGFSSLVAVAALVAGLSSSAQAQLTLTGLSCNNNGVMAYMGATSCSGAWEGNNKNQWTDVNAAILALTGGTSAAVVGDRSFSGKTSGTVSLGGPISGDFVLALKAANAFSLYYFTGAVGLTQINFKTDGVSVNKKLKPQDLSHATLYSVTGVPNDPPVDTSVVPEPSTYAMMVGGLIALGVAARRRRAA